MRNTFHRCAARMVIIIPLAALLYSPSATWAGPLTWFGPSFAVLGGSAVSDTGSTTINGNLGLWPGTYFIQARPNRSSKKNGSGLKNRILEKSGWRGFKM